MSSLAPGSRSTKEALPRLLGSSLPLDPATASIKDERSLTLGNAECSCCQRQRAVGRDECLSARSHELLYIKSTVEGLRRDVDDETKALRDSCLRVQRARQLLFSMKLHGANAALAWCGTHIQVDGRERELVMATEQHNATPDERDGSIEQRSHAVQEKKNAVVGADEDDEFCRCMVNGTEFAVPKRFTVMEAVGQGAYGQVCSAYDKELGETVAIKKVENVFLHIAYAKRTLRELKILRHLRHENIIDLRLVYLSEGIDDFKDVNIVSDLMESDLLSILKSPQPLSDDHYQFLLYQLLRGLIFLHSADVVHRDLKPGNLLVSSDCDLKICDFGLARVQYSKESHQTCPMTEYVATRWYRPPEVISNMEDVGKPLDMWSVGCIFAEMNKRTVLFPGMSAQHQMKLIIDCVGKPGKDALRKIPNEICCKFIQSLPSKVKNPLEQTFQSVTPQALDILKHFLRFDPESRLTAQTAVEHPYLELFHCPNDEPTRTPLNISDFEFERRKIDMQSLREEIYLEAIRYDSKKKKAYLLEQEKRGKVYNIANCRMLEPGESQYMSYEKEEATSSALPSPAQPIVAPNPDKVKGDTDGAKKGLFADAGGTGHIQELPFQPLDKDKDDKDRVAGTAKRGSRARSKSQTTKSEIKSSEERKKSSTSTASATTASDRRDEIRERETDAGLVDDTNALAGHRRASKEPLSDGQRSRCRRVSL